MDFFVTNGKFLLERTNEQRESRAVYKFPPFYMSLRVVRFNAI